MTLEERRAALAAARLYGILDLGYLEAVEVPVAARQLLQGGACPLQLRAKNLSPAAIRELAAQVLPLCREAGVPLIINDHPEIAAEVGADGVHVGQDDLSLPEVRAIVGRECLIGLSTHSVAQLCAAGEWVERGDLAAPDYLGFGPLFSTPTKPDYVPIGIEDVSRLPALTSLPVFCIGGIKLANLPEVLAAGARRVVVVSDLLLADDRAGQARQCRELLTRVD